MMLRVEAPPLCAVVLTTTEKLALSEPAVAVTETDPTVAGALR
jgi:hypothetical protein